MNQGANLLPSAPTRQQHPQGPNQSMQHPPPRPMDQTSYNHPVNPNYGHAGPQKPAPMPQTNQAPQRVAPVPAQPLNQVPPSTRPAFQYPGQSSVARPTAAAPKQFPGQPTGAATTPSMPGNAYNNATRPINPLPAGPAAPVRPQPGAVQQSYRPTAHAPPSNIRPTYDNPRNFAPAPQQTPARPSGAPDVVSLSAASSVDDSSVVSNFPTLDPNEMSLYVKPEEQAPKQVVAPPAAPAKIPAPPSGPTKANPWQNPPANPSIPKQPPTIPIARPAPVSAPAASIPPPTAPKASTLAQATIIPAPQNQAPPEQPQEVAKLIERIRLLEASEKNLRLSKDSLQKEISQLRNENARLRQGEADRAKLDALKMENDSLKSRIRALEATVPFQKNDSTDNEAQLVKLQARISELEEQLAKNQNSAAQVMLPASSQVAQGNNKSAISLRGLQSPPRHAPVPRTHQVDSPPVKGRDSEEPEAVSSGFVQPNDNMDLNTNLIQKEPEGNSSKRKRRASSLMPTGAEVTAKRRRLYGPDGTFSASEKQEEQHNVLRKLQVPQGAAYRLLSLADEAFLRLHQSFVAQQQQYAQGEPLQMPEYLEVRESNATKTRKTEFTFLTR